MRMTPLAVAVAGAAVAVVSGPAAAQDTLGGQPQGRDYLAPFQAMNDSGVSGMVAFKTEEGRLIASIGASGATPGRHMAHVHGFTGSDPQDASCPDAAADANDDGYIDLLETEQAAGTTLVPLHGNLGSLDLHGEDYPTAEQDGAILYLDTAGIEDLNGEMLGKFDTRLQLDRRVVFLHGVPEDTELPDSVQSLEGVPAHATLPIACAEVAVKPIDE